MVAPVRRTTPSLGPGTPMLLPMKRTRTSSRVSPCPCPSSPTVHARLGCHRCHQVFQASTAVAVPATPARPVIRYNLWMSTASYSLTTLLSPAPLPTAPYSVSTWPQRHLSISSITSVLMLLISSRISLLTQATLLSFFIFWW